MCAGLLVACQSEQKDLVDAVSGDSAKKTPDTKKRPGQFEPPDSTYSGDYYEKYETGIIKVRGYFRFGKKSGKWMYFFPNGNLWSEAFFKADKMNGESNVYHPNGKLMYNGYYKMDVADSIWTFYDTTGKMVETKDYRQLSKDKK